MAFLLQIRYSVKLNERRDMMEQRKMKQHSMSKIVMLHYVKLVFRSCLFLSASGIYLYNRVMNTGKLFGGLEENHLLLSFIWLCFFVEMILRFFPSHYESMGCQKQFVRNFEATDVKNVPRHPKTWLGTFISAVAWIGLNAVFAGLYLAEVIDTGIMVLLALAYSVCDIICILFFCPFQTWFLHNKCCGTCRIYNWDYAMMFTPFIFIKNGYSWSLLFVALILLLCWEISFRLHPERFCEATNGHLSCARCVEKLCHHKKQLRYVWKKNGIHMRGNGLLKKDKSE